MLVELLHHVGEDLVRGLVEVAHGDARREAREVRVLGRHVGRRLGRELVELVGRDAVVDALDDLLGQDLRRAVVRPLARSETAQNKKINHPLHCEMEASRVDGVKAPQHRRTLGQDVRLDVLAVQAVAELLDAARDLVVADDLLLAVALDHVDVVVVLGDAGLVPLQGCGPAVGGFVGILSRGRVPDRVCDFWRSGAVASVGREP